MKSPGREESEVSTRPGYGMRSAFGAGTPPCASRPWAKRKGRSSRVLLTSTSDVQEVPVWYPAGAVVSLALIQIAVMIFT